MSMDWFSRSAKHKVVNYNLLISFIIWLLKPNILTSKHVIIGVVCYGENVGRSLVFSLSFIAADHVCFVYRKILVGIDSHAEQARVGLKIREIRKPY